MASMVSTDHIRFLLSRLRDRLRDRLWVKPLVVCLLSIATVFAAKLADRTSLADIAPDVAVPSVESLLAVMSTSMLVIATFSVGAMVSAYASASSMATPRSFPLIVADDASQNALSTFVGAFIFGIVALTAVNNEYYGRAGLFILFVLTVMVFSAVILTFVRWVDQIARLGRMGSTIEKVETATAEALRRRREAPRLHGVPVIPPAQGRPVFATTIGYVQRVDVSALQKAAEEQGIRVVVSALPGTFITPGRALAYVSLLATGHAESDDARLIEAFEIGRSRRFEHDPRFGLVVLSEIAGRALSPAVNDPGTAIDVLGTFVRLFALWKEPEIPADKEAPTHDRVEVPVLSVHDMFDDAFTSIGRDGAGMVEVGVRLQVALHALAELGPADLRAAAEHHGQLALRRASVALTMADDLTAVQNAGGSVDREYLQAPPDHELDTGASV